MEQGGPSLHCCRPPFPGSVTLVLLGTKVWESLQNLLLEFPERLLQSTVVGMGSGGPATGSVPLFPHL